LGDFSNLRFLGSYYMVDYYN